MPAKAYWIVRGEVSDANAYARYVALNGEAFKKHGARFLVRGGRAQTVEGEGRTRNVIIEFPSMDQALAGYESAEYQAAKAQREGAAEIDIVVVEAYDGPQP
jgi:uncharacterized protein (DUF1330 family)